MQCYIFLFLICIIFLTEFIWILPFNLQHDCNLFSILFLSCEVLYCKGLNYDMCYVIHYHTFYSLNVIVTHSLDVVFVAEFISLYYKIKTIFTCTTLISLTVVNERINQTIILIPIMILFSFANPKFAALQNWYCYL